MFMGITGCTAMFRRPDASLILAAKAHAALTLTKGAHHRTCAALAVGGVDQAANAPERTLASHPK